MQSPMRITFCTKQVNQCPHHREVTKKNIFFTELFPLADSRHSALFSFRIEKGRRAFEEEENEILQRNIEENSNNIVQNQEQE